MGQVARYTALRLLVFFGVLSALWLVGMRGYLLLIVAAVVSTVVSYIVLARFRDQTAHVIQEKVEARSARAQQMREAEDYDDE